MMPVQCWFPENLLHIHSDFCYPRRSDLFSTNKANSAYLVISDIFFYCSKN